MRLPLLLLVLVSGLARAEQTCATPTENHQRLAFIQTHLNEDARRARLWTGAWGAGYGVLTLGQLAAVPAVPSGEQVDLYVGALSSAGGLVALLAMPLDVVADSTTLDTLAREHPSEVDCDVLAEAERLLVRGAEGEALGRSWLMHGANVLYGLLSGLVLGLAFDRWVSGAVTAVTGILIGEAMILTQPFGAEETLRRYREGAWSASRSAPSPAWNLQVAVAPSRIGVQLHVSF
ncbi:hypothetical protein D187_006486 [Cystobacter fuscus DSM 2262]|uniref:Uncharacterized protein n=1 Tax=Cystobacter fuscus (strain ATCC 25194 / DSM 2262 / NBRC 100088 / M29) TaxID=1242864 RepID=S9PJ53_CYSF2|nr:hypothetical protein [Cystobacter fuscus]EPX63076.1 hypothetical protein D187_006486 [Cystobacter fuscus DSM 2262]